MYIYNYFNINIVFCLFLLLLNGCSLLNKKKVNSDDTEKKLTETKYNHYCPSIEIVRDSHPLVRINKIKDEKNNISYIARLYQIKWDCEKRKPFDFLNEKKHLENIIEIEIIIEVEKVSKIINKNIEYFIVLSNGIKNIVSKNIIKKKVDIDIDETGTQLLKKDTITIKLPYVKDIAKNLIIFIGFQLTKKELLFNRGIK